ncbi:MAG: hypothetical protein ACFE9S_04345 [Candidatus Hermodarchaeota archaeon]
MNFQIVDAKLKNLIQVCKETKNYRKLAVVSFILTSNKVNEIGIHLGVRPRNRISGEKIFEYMELINEIFQKNLKIPIFNSKHIETIRECEALFLKSRGDIPYDYIKTIFQIYYELRKLDVLNLHKGLEYDNFIDSSKLDVFSFLSPKHKRKKRHSSDLRPLILQKIRERELKLQKNLQQRLDSQQFETAIYLRSIKNSLTKDRKGKITIHGALKDNIRYQNSIENIYGYFIIGLIILLASVGIVILLELSIIPVSSSELSSWTLFFFGGAILLIFIYIKLFRREKV